MNILALRTNFRPLQILHTNLHPSPAPKYEGDASAFPYFASRVKSSTDSLIAYVVSRNIRNKLSCGSGRPIHKSTVFSPNTGDTRVMLRTLNAVEF